MSIINLALAKSFLDIIHSADDTKLQMLLDAAEDEAAQFMNRPFADVVIELGDGEEVTPPSAVVGVMLLLQAAYQASPDDVPKLRAAAEVKLMPYRIEMGV